jgi:hypothetical protein
MEDENGVKAALEPTSTLSQILGKAALRGVADAAQNYSEKNKRNTFEMLERLWQMSKKAEQTEQFTGVLPENTPTWSKGLVFLTKWPKNLLP